MTHSEKIRQTIIERFGTYEQYLEQRYRNPENAEKRRSAASIAGKASQASSNAKQPFKDIPGLAVRAGKMSRVKKLSTEPKES
jgi:hypothetical protein